MIKYIKETIYPFDLHLLLGTKDKKVKHYIKSLDLKKKEKEEIIKALCMDYCKGVYYYSRSGISFIRVDSKKDISIVQHELLHFIFKVFSRMGIKHCYKSEEAFTYYLEYLTKEIYGK